MSGSLPSWLSGLPIGTGVTYSAVACRVSVLRIMKILPKYSDPGFAIVTLMRESLILVTHA